MMDLSGLNGDKTVIQYYYVSSLSIKQAYIMPLALYLQ